MGNYDDIINLPHPSPKGRPRMDMADRAAQFAPFAALTGYDDAIDEEGRITQQRVHLGEDGAGQLNDLLIELSAMISTRPAVAVTYFVPDGKKEGGAYLSFSGVLGGVDAVKKRLVFECGTAVAFDDIVSLTIL